MFLSLKKNEGNQAPCRRQKHYLNQPFRTGLIIHQHRHNHGCSVVLCSFRRHLHQSDNSLHIIIQPIIQCNGKQNTSYPHQITGQTDPRFLQHILKAFSLQKTIIPQGTDQRHLCQIRKPHHHIHSQQDPRPQKKQPFFLHQTQVQHHDSRVEKQVREIVVENRCRTPA